MCGKRGGHPGQGRREAGREDACQPFHVLPVLPLSFGFALRNLLPAVFRAVLNWPYWWDLFAQKGDIWTEIITGPDLPVLALHKRLPEMLPPAKPPQL